MSPAPGPIAEAFEAHRRALWDLGYRMTGTTADADDVVQETFTRTVASPPPKLDALRPWLFRIAISVGRDVLRRRKRQPYAGSWLPSPVETGDAAEPEDRSPEVRYGRLESASFAFLLALEALTPKQRAVLLLRDVFDYSLEDTAKALGATVSAVGVLHHRARAAMARYDSTRAVPTRALQARTRRALESFLGAVLEGNLPALEAMLAEDARSLSDTAGEALAALNALDGPWRVARYFLGISRKTASLPSVFDIQMLNGLPTLLVRLPDAPGSRIARRLVVPCEVDPATGRIRALHVVAASRKLQGLHFPAPPAP